MSDPPIRAWFHVQHAARVRYGIEAPLIGADGDLVTADVVAIRRLAARMAADRPPGTPAIGAGEIGALGILHEIGHLVVHRYEAERRPDAMTAAVADLGLRLGRGAMDGLLDAFAAEFPPGGDHPEPPAARLEELLLTRIANENPALGALRELVDDRPLERTTPYRDAITALEAILGGEPSFGPGDDSIIELLRTPARRSPTSLAGQLRFVRDHWTGWLGDPLTTLVTRLDLALGILAEEEHGLQRRFGGTGAGADDAARIARSPRFSGTDEPEAFSSDAAWMPQVVLMAKSTYVWLDQLSKSHGRQIRTLDAIPDEELETLARWGVTGLWLIGLWERSRASERIKRMRGNLDAVASAYSLDDYRIAEDLGGDDAYADLRDRAWARGIRLASDMVPNHMGIDSRWVIEHPEWFLSLPEPPYPAYAFTGADLSSDPRVGIVLEDHYWDDTDAAVVFQRIDRRSGETRYVYHGNDGTSFPWNDTAQLDFLKASVREQVIETILAVARRFPIIRFDAAMVLAKRHIQRLWWPEPGDPGGIPSRAEHAMAKAAFDALMPTEFWRDVVDRVAAEVPGTLLLAEAFWMLEGYFVRTLGMHRVYNSAFMHMLRDEDGAGYRRLIRETLAFDPEILKRYVNFMSNPDEATAIEQFGTGDKYVGVATVMATMPGLPMLGHGQVQGFREKYGMEYRRARLDEHPDPHLLERHEREIFPLLHRRAWFAEAADFLLYDLHAERGAVDEHVVAYSNGSGPTRSLVLFHDRSASTSGWIRESAPVARRTSSGARRRTRRSLAEGLGLPDDPEVFVTFRDARTGLESLRSCRDLWERGLHVALGPYGGHVYWEFREVHDGSAGQWSRLAARLGERAVPSLEDALRDLQLEPVHAPLRAVFGDAAVSAIIDGDAAAAGAASDADLDRLATRWRTFFASLGAATDVDGDPAAIAAEVRGRTADAARWPGSTHAEPGDGRVDRAAQLAWLGLSRMGAMATGADVAATSRAWYDELRLADALVAGLQGAGLDDGAAWAAADRVRVLLTLPRPSGVGRPVATADARLLDRWLADDLVRAAIGVNTWEGVEWLDRDAFAAMLAWAVRLDALDGRPAPKRGGPDVVTRLTAAAEAAGYAVAKLRTILSRTGSAAAARSAVRRGR